MITKIWTLALTLLITICVIRLYAQTEWKEKGSIGGKEKGPGAICCWAFFPTTPSEVKRSQVFDAKVLSVDPRNSTVDVKIEGKERTYTLKEIGGGQSELLRKLKKGDEVKATFIEPMKMYHLERVK
jgi:hypothetical protein